MKHALKMTHTLNWKEINWNEDLCERKIEEDKTDSMLWLGFKKLLRNLIGDENMEKFMEYATIKVSIFL